MRRVRQIVVLISLLATLASLIPATPASAQPTEAEYHLAAIDYAVKEQAGTAARMGYPLSRLKADAEIVGKCENGLRAYSKNRSYLTSWQHGKPYWPGRLKDYRNWIAMHNANNPNQQLAAADQDHLDPLTGARVTIWWLLHRHGGTWRGTSGWPHCGRKASR